MLAVSVVMALVGIVLLQLRSSALEQDALNLVRAHARTLQIAIEERHSTDADKELKPLLERLVRENQAVANVILYDARGEILTAAPAGLDNAQLDTQAARQAMATRQEVRITRRLANQEVISLILPEPAPNPVNNSPFGAIEISVAVAFVNTEVISERNDIVLLGLITCLTIFGVVWLVTRRSLGRHISDLVTGAQALGKGDLTYRVAVPTSNNDFKVLADAFNQMAGSLSEQQQLAVQESETRLKLERRLRHSERLAAVGHLAAGVAHEMGAPLQVIDGRAKQLQEQAHPTSEKLQRNLKIIRTQGDRITRIVRSLLMFARPVHPHLQSVDLSQQVSLALEALETQAAPARVIYDHVAGAAPIWVKADTHLLQQVLTNLFVNAIQAMPEGGVLRVRYPEPVRKEGRGFAGVSIADTGYGIPPENLEQIFDPFFSTKEVGSGTGLGLSISSRIVEEHEGWLSADNWKNDNGESGAVFTFYLPQAIAPSVETRRSHKHEYEMMAAD
jgi:signal transduction histidine kinase